MWYSVEDLPNDPIVGRVLMLPVALWWAVDDHLHDLTQTWGWGDHPTGHYTATEAAALLRAALDSWISSMIGHIEFSARANPDPGWLLCDGALYQRVDLPELYEHIAPVYHISADLLAVPDLRRRLVVGSGQGYALGDTHGAESTTLTTGNLPPHSHTVDGLAGGLAVSPGELPVAVPTGLPGLTGNVGSGSPVDIRNPALAADALIFAGRDGVSAYGHWWAFATESAPVFGEWIVW